MNYWHLAAAISVWLMAVAIGAIGVGLWNAEQPEPVGEPWRAYGPILSVLMLIIAGLYAWGGVIFLAPR